MASAADILRAASAIIESGGWSQGAVARDGNGRPAPLFGGTGGDTSRAAVNRDAVSFSLYGAICKATSDAGGCSRLPLLWDVLFRLCSVTDVPYGGTNHVHPVLEFNETEGRTKDEVLALLELAAQDCEQIGEESEFAAHEKSNEAQGILHAMEFLETLKTTQNGGAA